MKSSSTSWEEVSSSSSIGCRDRMTEKFGRKSKFQVLIQSNDQRSKDPGCLFQLTITYLH